jgi:hypothetical protein
MVKFDLFSFTVSISRKQPGSTRLAKRYEDNLRINHLIEENKRKQNEHMHFWH